MIFELLDALNNPQHYRIKLDRDGIALLPVEAQEPITMLDLIATLTAIAANEEFTEHQRREQMIIAINEAEPKSGYLPSFIAPGPLESERRPDGALVLRSRQQA